MASTISPEAQATGRHEAFMYGSQAEFLERTTAFIREGLANGEHTMVALDAAKLDQLRDRLGAGGDLVRWVDIAGIGGNPARITSLWLEFASGQGSGPLRGIGEPIWPRRERAELLEAHLHEALLNVALAESPRLRLLCPYDLQGLDPTVIAEARRTHPLVSQGGAGRGSPDYLGEAAAAVAGDATLPEPVTDPLLDRPLDVTGPSIAAVTTLVVQHATDAGLEQPRAEHLALALLTAEEMLHSDGDPDRVRLWREPGRLICEIRSSRVVQDPLAGRRPPSVARASRGLWLSNQLCDLVELRSSAAGTVARLHMVVGR